MKNWKTRAAAMGMVALVMVPTAAYGQSVYWETYGEGAYQKLWNIKTYYELWQKKDPTYDSGESKPVSATVAQTMLAQVNAQRREAGVAELTLSAQLSEVAQAKAEDMRDIGYFSHTSPTYGSPFDMMKSFGISYRAAGENIAKGYRSVDQVMEGWMNSSGHRANILSSGYTQMGVGYCTDSSGNGYWVQMFIRQ